MDNRPIGVFDSGLGGLTAVKQLIDVMPCEDIVYFGDTGRVPYGNKGRDTIIRYTRDDISFLLNHNIKIIIAACGTASSVALPHLEDFGVKVIGVLEPACRAAVSRSKNGKIGVIGTLGTVKSGKYAQIINSISPEAKVFSVACPMFVPLVENGYAEGEVARMIAADYLTPLKEEGVDTLILGCTHYPLLEGVIGDIMGKDVELISSGREAACYAKALLTEADMLTGSAEPGAHEFYVSDSAEHFAELGGIFLGQDIELCVHQTEI